MRLEYYSLNRVSRQLQIFVQFRFHLPTGSYAMQSSARRFNSESELLFDAPYYFALHRQHKKHLVSMILSTLMMFKVTCGLIYIIYIIILLVALVMALVFQSFWIHERDVSV